MSKIALFSQLNTALPWLDDTAKTDLLTYMGMVLEKNKVLNLTAITDEAEFIKKHFVDSLSLINLDICQLKSRADAAIIDVGTGAGFPGIPLAIALRGRGFKFTLCDSLQKRLDFLADVVRTLNLEGVELVHARAEDLAHEVGFNEKFDIAVARAVSSLPELSELCLPFVKVGGSFVAYKMAGSEDEIESAKGAIEILGGDVQNIGVSSYYIGTEPDDRKRVLIEIKKTSSTPGKYPRKPNEIKKRPL
jgi:16S rRNA (guanine527-N7)-methyltransferase